MRVCVFVEGPSDKQFFDAIVKPYVISKNPRITRIWSIDAKGVGQYESKKYIKLRQIIETQICTDNEAVYSTMFDYYAFPKNIPKFKFIKRPDPYEMVKERETAFRQAILAEDKFSSFCDRIDFHPYLMLHEYETLMYCDLDQISILRDSNVAGIRQLKNDVRLYENIEFINDGLHSAPSKRIMRIIPSYEYQKTSNAIHVMEAIGIGQMLENVIIFANGFGGYARCKIFD